jgi:hypothetical protein
MEAVLSGQAGVALLGDGGTLSSIHVHDLDTSVARRAGEFHYLFGAASDLVFVENISPDNARQEFQAAVDGEDATQLKLLLLATDRPEDIRRTAAEELSELLSASPHAAACAERLLLSTALPHEADVPGALLLSSEGPGRDFLQRVGRLQPYVRRAQEAFEAIPEDVFGPSPEDCRTAADAACVREGVVRQFVLAAAGDLGWQGVVLAALQIPAVRSLPNHRNIVMRWKSNLNVVEQTTAIQDDLSVMAAVDAQWEDDAGRRREPKMSAKYRPHQRTPSYRSSQRVH